MASKSENSKQAKLRKKRRKRKLNAQGKIQKQSQLAVKHRYPKFIFDEFPNADPEFVKAVRIAVDLIDFDDQKSFTDQHRQVFRTLSSRGAVAAFQQIYWSLIAAGIQDETAELKAFNFFMITVGDAIFNGISFEELNRFLPYNDVSVSLEGQTFRLKFCRLDSELLDRQRLFFSRHKPTVSVDGKKRVVAFTSHSIERIRERLGPRWMEYSTAGNVFAYFAHCQHFELCLLHQNQEAIACYDQIPPDCVPGRRYLDIVLGVGNYDSSKGIPYNRLGYCPITISGDFAIAKTFLRPGFKATPEYGLILESNLNRNEKDRLLGFCQNSYDDTLLNDEDIELIKWFHDNGVPQVIQSKTEFFNYD